MFTCFHHRTKIVQLIVFQGWGHWGMFWTETPSSHFLISITFLEMKGEEVKEHTRTEDETSRPSLSINLITCIIPKKFSFEMQKLLYTIYEAAMIERTFFHPTCDSNHSACCLSTNKAGQLVISSFLHIFHAEQQFMVTKIKLRTMNK